MFQNNAPVGSGVFHLFRPWFAHHLAARRPTMSDTYFRLEAIAARVEAIAIRVKAMATRVKAICY